MGELLERLARLEHHQWCEWNRKMPKPYQKPHLWIDYDDLPEEEKEKDREWAKAVLFEIQLHLYDLLTRETAFF